MDQLEATTSVSFADVTKMKQEFDTYMYSLASNSSEVDL